MVEYSRRALLVTGGVTLGAVVVGGTALAVTAGRHPSPSPSPMSAPASTPASSPAPTLTPMPAPSPGTTPITQLGDPTWVASLAPATAPVVMQQVERIPTGEYFITQSVSGSGEERYTTIVSRYAGTATLFPPAQELDAMTVLDGGHGLGLHVELGADGAPYVWTSLQGDVPQRDPAGGRLARFAYTAGTFAIDAIPGGVQYLPQFPNGYGELQEAIYTFDWSKGYAVERMYDFHTNHQERFTRRAIGDIVSGVDRALGQLTLPVNPPTMQGFATANNTFFRWTGVSNGGSGSLVADDPITLEQYDWSTGTLIGTKAFPTLGQEHGAWRDGGYEPEGCSVFRAADGTASLLVGMNTGAPAGHEWLVYEFARIGDV